TPSAAGTILRAPDAAEGRRRPIARRQSTQSDALPASETGSIGSQGDRAMALAERVSVCTFDCPDTCSLTVSVENDRIVKVRGSDALPYTAGVICNKVAHVTADFVH